MDAHRSSPARPLRAGTIALVLIGQVVVVNALLCAGGVMGGRTDEEARLIGGALSTAGLLLGSVGFYSSYFYILFRQRRFIAFTRGRLAEVASVTGLTSRRFPYRPNEVFDGERSDRMIGMAPWWTWSSLYFWMAIDSGTRASVRLSALDPNTFDMDAWKIKGRETGWTRGVLGRPGVGNAVQALLASAAQCGSPTLRIEPSMIQLEVKDLDPAMLEGQSARRWFGALSQIAAAIAASPAPRRRTQSRRFQKVFFLYPRGSRLLMLLIIVSIVLASVGLMGLSLVLMTVTLAGFLIFAVFSGLLVALVAAASSAGLIELGWQLGWMLV